MVGIGGDAEQAERAELLPQLRPGTRWSGRSRRRAARSGPARSGAPCRAAPRCPHQARSSACACTCFFLLDVALGSDQAHRHGKIGFGDLADRQPLVRPEPDDDAGDHLDDRHRGQPDIVDRRRRLARRRRAGLRAVPSRRPCAASGSPTGSRATGCAVPCWRHASNAGASHGSGCGWRRRPQAARPGRPSRAAPPPRPRPALPCARASA